MKVSLVPKNCLKSIVEINNRNRVKEFTAISEGLPSATKSVLNDSIDKVARIGERYGVKIEFTEGKNLFQEAHQINFYKRKSVFRQVENVGLLWAGYFDDFKSKVIMSDFSNPKKLLKDLRTIAKQISIKDKSKVILN